MATLHVSNVPDELYERLEGQARAQRRSLEAVVIALLEREVGESKPSPAEVLDSIRRRRYFEPAAADAPDSLSLLREDRAR